MYPQFEVHFFVQVMDLVRTESISQTPFSEFFLWVPIGPRDSVHSTSPGTWTGLDSTAMLNIMMRSDITTYSIGFNHINKLQGRCCAQPGAPEHDVGDPGILV